MKRLFNILSISALTLLLLSSISCNKDDKNTNSTTQEEQKGELVLIGSTVKNPDGMSGNSYLQLIKGLKSSSLDLSKSIERGFASSINVIDKYIYVLPAFGNEAAPFVRKYIVENGSLKEVAKLEIPANAYTWNIVKVDENKLYLPLYNLAKIFVIDNNSFNKIKEIDITEYAHTDSSPDAGYPIVRDGKYYLPLNQINPGFMPYDDYHQADVLIIDIKSDNVTKRISETSSELSFPARPYLSNTIFKTENNDIYIACSGAFAYNPMYKNNGFICIPNGQEDFDTTRSWDISNVTIEGTEYKPASIYNCLYVGNNIVLAYVGIAELNGNNPYTAKNAVAVKIDLANKTISKIDGIPHTDGFSIIIEKWGEKVLFSASGESASGIFSYDLNTAKVEQVLSSAYNIDHIDFLK